MEVILLEKVHNLGTLGDAVKVRPGYGRNYLLPQRKAVMATAANKAKLEEQRAEFEARNAKLLEAAQAQAEKITALEKITIAAKVADEGKLYGSVTADDVLTALAQADLKVAKNALKIPAGIIRHVGEYPAQVMLYSEVTADFTIVVVPEKAAV